MVKGAKAIMRGLDQIELIISEELEAYFLGGRTAEETAQILDSRIQIYLDENSQR